MPKHEKHVVGEDGLTDEQRKKGMKTKSEGNDPDRMTPGNTNVPIPSTGGTDNPVTTGEFIGSGKPGGVGFVEGSANAPRLSSASIGVGTKVVTGKTVAAGKASVTGKVTTGKAKVTKPGKK